MMQYTLALIKPDAIAAGDAQKILAKIKQAGFEVIRQEERRLDRKLAQEFYEEHKERPFFGELVDFIISGPVIALALRKDDAIKAWRDLMGPTNPAQAEIGTIRKDFGADIMRNAVHGSADKAAAHRELLLFFNDLTY